jgi:hypothetical protein
VDGAASRPLAPTVSTLFGLRIDKGKWLAGQGHFGCGCMSAGDGLTRGRDVKRGVFQRRGTAGP